ncbi:MAG TPA: PAC2 family protein [Candidatus Nesterenkonia stercoripullorum]|jgi:predicted ATP-grasp superfamily ATP-dependent carboligase|uniref:PAC2 family protein n=1 Tax=Candidatus Nesterenkonia stercoripullorum TaxID=2838701 RepID=A0A9D1UU68_9MICC|nr:PAC2 family protein [Candidatus Nesterenkonia stercoripullorum]
MVIAFEGWNDAGGAASSAVHTLGQAVDAQLIEKIDDERYYDYQFTRPKVRKTGSHREIVWPSTRIYRARPDSSDVELLLVTGVEPSFRWQEFVADLLTRAAQLHVDAIVVVGALLADVPHTRPIPTSLSGEDEQIQELLSIDEPTYEGPTGIVGVLAHTAYQAGVPAVSLWAAVPHYVGQAPSPKAQLALVRQLEDLLGLTLEADDVAEDAEAWERGVNDLAEDDAEIGDYVKQLEEATDTTTLPEASGEAIAQEFERYLRRRRPPRPDEGPEG